ncbi:MAG: SGNH/GDSL hydrolase family protein [Pirellulaceae bacterium]
MPSRALPSRALPWMLLLLLPLLARIAPAAEPTAAEPTAAESPYAPIHDRIELADGDTLVFLGDSITHQCLYTQYIEDFFYTRYPHTRIRFHNSGVGGDKAGDALARFDEDVARYKPKYVTILLGMNDGRYTRFEQDIVDTYERDMTTLLDQLAEIGATAVPMSPTIYDSRASRIRSKGENDGLREKYYNGVLAYYGAWLRERALERGLGYVDMYSPLNNLTLEQRKTDPEFTLVADAVHPGAAGQAVMAFAVLNDMHVNRQVSRLTVQRNAKSQWQVNAPRGEVSDVAATDGGLSFTYLAPCLPWVLPEEAALGYELTKAGHKMSNEQLRVAGLAAGKYELRIDGESVGAYSQQQLNFKIELQSNRKTPQYQQALAVALLNKQRNDEVVRPLRNLWRKQRDQYRQQQALAENMDKNVVAQKQAEYQKWREEFHAEIERLEALSADFEKKIYAAAQPKPRRYELVRLES